VVTDIRALFVLLIPLLVIAGCSSNDGPSVYIELTYAADSGETKLHYANVISGGDKFHWYAVSPNNTKTITLYPGKGSENKVTLFYQLTSDKPKQVWEGPEIQTEQGYRIHITILDSGEITERSCDLPCDLNL
jgi:hypothetical protein